MGIVNFRLDSLGTEKHTIIAKAVLSFGAICLLLFGVASPLRGDSLLYDNGPDNHDFSHIASLNNLFELSDDFLISSSATLDRVVWAEDTVPLGANGSLPPAVPATVNWCIGTTAFAKDVACGTGMITATATTFGASPYSNYISQFSLPNLSVGAGAYFLSLTDTTNNDGFHNGYWGTSATTGGNAQFMNTSSGATNNTGWEMSFQIYGQTGSPTVPEPPTLVLLVAGLGSVWVFCRRWPLA